MEDKMSNSEPSPSDKFLSELLEEISDPVHKRIIKAYQDNDPVGSMEEELSKILLEVLSHED